MIARAALVLLCLVTMGLTTAGCGKAPESASAPGPAPSAPEPARSAPPPPPQEIIIDNVDPGCQVVSGAWASADASDGSGPYGDDFLYLHADADPGAVRFTPDIKVAGKYTVYIYWSADPNRTAAQPVTVHDATGDKSYTVNLQQNGNQWFKLGPHTFNTGANAYIEFTNNTEDGYCNADAVRLVSDF